MLCIAVPSSNSDNGNVFPVAIGAFFEDITSLPTSNPFGAKIYRFSPST